MGIGIVEGTNAPGLIAGGTERIVANELNNNIIYIRIQRWEISGRL